jgi:hypothetical protein
MVTLNRNHSLIPGRKMTEEYLNHIRIGIVKYYLQRRK